MCDFRYWFAMGFVVRVCGYAIGLRDLFSRLGCAHARIAFRCLLGFVVCGCVVGGFGLDCDFVGLRLWLVIVVGLDLFGGCWLIG